MLFRALWCQLIQQTLVVEPYADKCDASLESKSTFNFQHSDLLENTVLSSDDIRNYVDVFKKWWKSLI